MQNAAAAGDGLVCSARPLRRPEPALRDGTGSETVGRGQFQIGKGDSCQVGCQVGAATGKDAPMVRVVMVLGRVSLQT